MSRQRGGLESGILETDTNCACSFEMNRYVQAGYMNNLLHCLQNESHTCNKIFAISDGIRAFGTQ